MDTSKYQELFISEAEEYLEQISDSILELERNPSNKDAVSNMFRGLHTIKGMSASMGYGDIAKIAHQLEDIADLIRNGRIKLYKELIDIMLKGNDYIDGMVHNVKVNPDVLNSFSSVINSIKTGTSQSVSPPTSERKSINAMGFEIEFTDDIILKSARAFVVIKTVQDSGYFLDTDPSYDDIMKEQFDRTFSVLVKKGTPVDEIREKLSSIPEVRDVRVIEEKSETLPLQQEEDADSDETGIRMKKDIKVSLDRLDNLQNYASELVIARGRLQQLSYGIEDNELLNALNNTSKIIANIQDEVMKIRMVPVWQVFDRYPRYIRDLSSKLNKKINFIIRGRDIELDRTLLNTLADPLLHLLRNSVDHGIETPEERKKSGKDEEGSLVLEAKRLKNAIMISVSDDGKGIDENRILIKAIEKGLVTEEQAKNMTKQEIFNFITYSGFSTKEEATDVSGRGVGVDAVKNVLKKIGGSFEIRSETGAGTAFNLKVPLTLAIIKSLIISVEKERYIIPLTHINETIDISAERIQSIMGREVFVLRDEIIPIIRLSEIFGINVEKEREKYSLVIVSVDDYNFALLIDSFIEQSEIVVKPLRGVLSGIRGLAGVTILNDGLPSFIIDVPSIFEMAKVR